MADTGRIFIGRQPILDRRERIVAYELLFRDSAESQCAVFSDQRVAVTRVIADTFASLGARAVLGPCRGFFNVDRQTLLDDVVEALPSERVTIEILEGIEADQEVVERCRALRRRHFSLALDDYVHRDTRDALLAYVDWVKIDLMAVADRLLPPMVRRLRRHRVRLLAEKVETREVFERCRRLGFDSFQGFYFARPAVICGTRVDPERATVLHLLQQIGRDADTDELCETFKHHVELGVNLLRLVNSAVMTRRTRVATVRDAVTFLGRRHLNRWLNILLFAGSDPRGFRSPLLLMAARRGRLMELVARESPDAGHFDERGERAFLVGMLSLIDALFSRPLAELVAELELDREIEAALLERAGELGALLRLVEGLERGDFAAVADLSERLGIAAERISGAELQANLWVHDLSDAAGG